MAINKTLSLNSITYRPLSGTSMPDQLVVEYKVTVDDPEDDMLPIYTIYNFSLTAESDVSNEENIVKNIFNSIFNK